MFQIGRTNTNCSATAFFLRITKETNSEHLSTNLSSLGLTPKCFKTGASVMASSQHSMHVPWKSLTDHFGAVGTGTGAALQNAMVLQPELLKFCSCPFPSLWLWTSWTWCVALTEPCSSGHGRPKLGKSTILHKPKRLKLEERKERRLRALQNNFLFSSLQPLMTKHNTQAAKSGQYSSKQGNCMGMKVLVPPFSLHPRQSFCSWAFGVEDSKKRSSLT